MEIFAQLAGIALVSAIAIFVPVTYLMSKGPQRVTKPRENASGATLQR
jgi:hypothetical protein